MSEDLQDWHADFIKRSNRRMILWISMIIIGAVGMFLTGCGETSTEPTCHTRTMTFERTPAMNINEIGPVLGRAECSRIRIEEDPDSPMEYHTYRCVVCE